MRVDDRHLTGDQAVQSGKTLNPQEVERLNESRRAESRPAAAADKVELSNLTGGLTRALEAAAQQRASRMEKLAEEYAAGRYQVDAQAVSRAIVAEMRAAGPSGGKAET
jgi:anti-sigma28 factor (negative regulator of flagellin synthesis)